MRTNWKAKAKILSLENHILRGQLETLWGMQKPYRVINQATGDILDFDTAQEVADHLFAVGGFDARRRFWLYKNRRPAMMPLTGEVVEFAAMLEGWNG